MMTWEWKFLWWASCIHSCVSSRFHILSLGNSVSSSQSGLPWRSLGGALCSHRERCQNQILFFNLYNLIQGWDCVHVMVGWKVNLGSINFKIYIYPHGISVMVTSREKKQFRVRFNYIYLFSVSFCQTFRLPPYISLFLFNF